VSLTTKGCWRNLYGFNISVTTHAEGHGWYEVKRYRGRKTLAQFPFKGCCGCKDSKMKARNKAVDYVFRCWRKSVHPAVARAIKRIVDITYENYEGKSRDTFREYQKLKGLSLGQLLHHELSGFEPKN